MKLTYNKDDFFDEDGWIKFDSFKVVVGGKGELEYIDTMKNKSYYEQNPYYTIVGVSNMENDIQDDVSRFEELIKEKIGGKRKEMKELKVTVTKDSFRDDTNWSQEKLYNFFVKGDDSFDWSYNITQDVFGYGSDPMEWEANDENYINTSQIIAIDPDEKPNEYIIYFDDSVE